MDAKENKMESINYLNLYKDMISKMVEAMLPNCNPAYNRREKTVKQVFSQYEVAYIVENLQNVDQQTAWTFVPSLVRNLKMENFVQVDGRHFESIALDGLLKQINVAVETNLEGGKTFNQQDDVVKVVLLMTAVLRMMDEINSPKLLIVNEDIQNVKEVVDLKLDNLKFELSNATSLESLDSDFKIEPRPFSESMAKFLQSSDVEKKKKNRKRSKRSVDSALDSIIVEVQSSAARAKNLSQNLNSLDIVDKTIVHKKAEELRSELAKIKLNCDEFVSKYLDDELIKKMEGDIVVDVAKDTSLRDDVNTEMPLKNAAKNPESLRVDVNTKLPSNKVAENAKSLRGDFNTEIPIKDAESLQDNVIAESSTKKVVQISGSLGDGEHSEIKTKDVAENAKSLLVIDKSKRAQNSLFGSSTSDEFVLSCNQGNMASMIKKILMNECNRIHILIPTELSVNMVHCTPCNINFNVRHLNLSNHVNSVGHLDKLETFYLNLQKQLLDTFPDIASSFQLPSDALLKDKIFIDPSAKLVYCISCQLSLEYADKVVCRHLKCKEHINQVSCMIKKPRRINTLDERVRDNLRGNRIIGSPLDNDSLNCIPCDAELTTQLTDVMQHIESDTHRQTLDEYNYKVQKEIIKSNHDIFGHGKRYPLIEKHIRHDKIFLNPVADYAYCGICRKSVIVKFIENEILEHLTTPEHAINLELSEQHNEDVPKSTTDKDADKSSVVKRKHPSECSVVQSKQRRYEELLDLPPTGLWYMPLEEWLKLENEQDVATSAPPIKSNDAIELIERVNKPHEPKPSPKKKEIEDKNLQPEKKKKKKEAAKIQILAETNQLFIRPSYVKCKICSIQINVKLESVLEHTEDILHVVRLCKFNVNRQKFFLRNFPKIFAPDQPFHMTTEMIEKDTIFIDPLKKSAFCGCCAMTLKYSRPKINAHIAEKCHLHNKTEYATYLDEYNGNTESKASKIEEKNKLKVKSGTNDAKIFPALLENSPVVNKHGLPNEVQNVASSSRVKNDATVNKFFAYQSNAKKVYDDYVETIKTAIENISGSSTAKNKGDKCLETQEFVDTNVAKSTKSKNADEKSVDTKQIVNKNGSKSFKANNADAKSVETNETVSKNVAKSSKDEKAVNNKTQINTNNKTIKYGMDSRLLKEIPDRPHIEVYIVKKDNKYRCVDCDYNGIVSIPMAFAHLRSCFHNPVVVEGVQFLKEANYHCIVCRSKLYGIKNVVEHIEQPNHQGKLDNYYNNF